jgi:LCP family protein required for cell wall assembly
MKKENRKEISEDISIIEDDRDESQLIGRKAAEYNRKNVVRHRKRVRTKILCALGILLALLAILAVITVILVNVWRSTGRAGLRQHAQTTAEDAPSGMQAAAMEKDTDASQEEASYELQEGQIRYNGKTYQYKENLMNILCLGIDSRDGIAKEKTPGKAGQADCVILAVLDDDAKTIQLINISRDSMVPVHVYATDGSFVEDRTEQLALQYAYGNGRDWSCQLMEEAVSDLFYGLPIHGYCALSMNSIADLNDAVGGVTVTVPEELAELKPNLFTAGETVTLKGDLAYHFVHDRAYKSADFASNNKRIARQKRYAIAFVNQLKQGMKEDMTLPVKLYQTAEKQMVTSISLDQAVYLCTEYMENIYTIDGTVTMGEKYAEFNVDDDALYQLILDVFYEEVN